MILDITEPDRLIGSLVVWAERHGGHVTLLVYIPRGNPELVERLHGGYREIASRMRAWIKYYKPDQIETSPYDLTELIPTDGWVD